MAGNVREWTQSLVEPEARLILGGAWNSQAYLYDEPLSLLPFDRSPENGIRCVRNVSPLPAAVTAPIKRFDRDFSKFRPASDEVFAAYRVMYDYPRSMPLHTALDSADPKGFTGLARRARDVRCRVWWRDGCPHTCSSRSGSARRIKPSSSFRARTFSEFRSSETLGDEDFFDYIVQSGRAVLYPVFQDTYERRVKHTLPGTARTSPSGRSARRTSAVRSTTWPRAPTSTRAASRISASAWERPKASSTRRSSSSDSRRRCSSTAATS